MSVRDALKAMHLLSSLSNETLNQLAGFSALRSVRAGETIFCQGEPSPYCFGVCEGEVLIQRVAKNSRFPPKILSVMTPGSLFGESCIFEDSPRAAMASASKDGRLVVIRGTRLREWVKQEPVTGCALMTAMLQTALTRLRQTSHELSVLYGVGRLLGSTKPFEQQAAHVLDFLRGSLEEIDEIALYERSPYWEEFTCRFPAVPALPALPGQSTLVHLARTTTAAMSVPPGMIPSALADARLPWADMSALALVPLMDWEDVKNPLSGMVCLGSRSPSLTFSSDVLLLLSSVALPLAEAISRERRAQDNHAQARLHQSKSSLNI